MICTIDLPPRAPGPKPPAYTAEVDHLKAHPGEWFTIKDGPTKGAAWSTAANIRNGKLVAFRPAKNFQVYTEGQRVNARYVPAGKLANE